MKVWITGASGLAGRAVTEVLSKSHEVYASGFNRISELVHKVDLTSEEEVEKVFKEQKPEAVIHLAAERKPDVCENNHDLTLQLNVSASKSLAALCKKYDAWLLNMSTDYVFDGANPPYETDAETNPLNFYGLSKLKGEQAVLNENSAACVLRVPVLYGRVEDLKESAVTSIATALLNQDEVKVDHWAVRYPTLVDDIACVIRMMLDVKPQGIFHYSASESMSKYEILQIMAASLGISSDHVSPAEGKPSGAPRPHDCHLSASALKEINCFAEPLSIREVIGEILRPHI